jgi:hypothetical protein
MPNLSDPSKLDDFVRFHETCPMVQDLPRNRHLPTIGKLISRLARTGFGEHGWSWFPTDLVAEYD